MLIFKDDVLLRYLSIFAPLFLLLSAPGAVIEMYIQGELDLDEEWSRAPHSTFECIFKYIFENLSIEGATMGGNKR